MEYEESPNFYIYNWVCFILVFGWGMDERKDSEVGRIVEERIKSIIWFGGEYIGEQKFM